MRLAILGIGVAALLYWMLDLILDVRGASPFVRPFHTAGILLTVAAATSVFWALLRVVPTGLRRQPLALTIIYLAFIFGVWHFTLPLGDHVAELRERATRTPYEVGDTGYGWFYWDDSGMGNWPTTMLLAVLGSIRAPVPHVLLVTFVYMVFKIPVRAPLAEQDVAAQPLTRL